MTPPPQTTQQYIQKHFLFLKYFPNTTWNDPIAKINYLKINIKKRTIEINKYFRYCKKKVSRILKHKSIT